MVMIVMYSGLIPTKKNRHMFQFFFISIKNPSENRVTLFLWPQGLIFVGGGKRSVIQYRHTRTSGQLKCSK